MGVKAGEAGEGRGVKVGVRVGVGNGVEVGPEAPPPVSPAAAPEPGNRMGVARGHRKPPPEPPSPQPPPSATAQASASPTTTARTPSPAGIAQGGSRIRTGGAMIRRPGISMIATEMLSGPPAAFAAATRAFAACSAERVRTISRICSSGTTSWRPSVHSKTTSPGWRAMGW